MQNTDLTNTANSSVSITAIQNFGDARRFILQAMVDLRNGDIGTNTAMALAANMKVLNDNIQAEINYAKTSMIAQEKGHDFGKIISMGKNIIG